MAYQPASVQTSTASLTHLATVWYDKVAVENLKANLPFVAASARRKLPNRSGKTIQMFSYSLLAANTTPGSEGTVGTGIAPTTVNRSATVEQYFDFMSFSDILDETAIDPIVENSAAEMGYRAALTANTLARSEFEGGLTCLTTSSCPARLFGRPRWTCAQTMFVRLQVGSSWESSTPSQPLTC